MGLRIATNIASMAAQRALSSTSQGLEKHYERIASGRRIVSAGDDAAGLSISENLRAQYRSMLQAERNANDGLSFVQVAEGGLNEIGNILVRMRELQIQAASDTVGDRERGFIDQEVQSLKAEVDRIANVTNFNGTPLLNAGASKSKLEVQVGIRNNEEDKIQIDTAENDARADALGIGSISSTSVDDARSALDAVDEGLGKVNAARARLGALQNKMHSAINNLGISKENLNAARSRIADTDIAQESAELISKNITQQAGVAVLAQANMAPTLALKLMS